MRRRILLLVAGITVLVVLAFAIPVAFLVRSAVGQRGERSIRDEAEGVAHFLAFGHPTNAQVTSYLATQTQSADRCVSVTLPDGTLLGRAAPHSGGPQPLIGPRINPSGPPAGSDPQVHSVPG